MKAAMLNQTTGYAITALGHIAGQHGKPRLIKDVAEATGLPSSYLAKIINTLARKDIVVTQRGIGGGVMLAREPETITFFEVAEAFDDPLLKQRCMLGTAECSDERACPTHDFWKGHREKEIAFLKARTLKDIAEFETRPKREGVGAM